jgi:moderate conductance mechanosensitive channel
MGALLAGLTWDRVGDWVADPGIKIVSILVAVFLLNRALRAVVPPALRTTVLRDATPLNEVDLKKRAETLGSVLLRTAQGMFLLIAMLMVLDELGFTVAPFLTGLGIGGIALGLGAQSLVRDTINGIFILVENQFGRGDFVTIAGVQGWVEDINLRRTVIRDADGALFTIPNGEIKVSGNLTRGYSGINLLIPLAGTADLDKAIALIDEAGKELAAAEPLGPLVLEPPRAMRVEGLSSTGVTIRVIGKVAPGAHFEVAGALRRRIKRAFDEAKLPFADPPPPPAPAPPAPAGAPPTAPAPPPRPA